MSLLPQNTAFILVHDAWHAGWAWQEVGVRLAERGWGAFSLDLPGHGHNILEQDSDYRKLSLPDYAHDVVTLVQRNPALQKRSRFILVGHGMAGPVVQLAAEQLGQQVAGLIFIGAYILRDGESIAGQMPPEMARFFQELADARPDGRIDLAQAPEFWRDYIINDAPSQAQTLLARLTPEPSGPMFEPIRLETFFSMPRPPCAYISFNEDMSLPPGDFHPRMPNKLGPYRHVNINAGHEGILTKPREVAETMIFLASNVFG